MNRKATQFFLSDWSSIRQIQNLGVVRSMYVWLFIVPLLAKAFSEVGGFADINIFDHEFKINLKLPFSWVIFYMSAMSFVIANIFYQIFCPHLIKDHSDYSSFDASGKQRQHLENYKQMLNPAIGFEESYELEDNRDSVTEPDRELFWRLFAIANNKSKAPRMVATILGHLGFFLIAYVVLENLIAVYHVSIR